MDRPGVRQVPESSGEQGKMEKTGCKIICGAPTTLAVKGLVMMMMMMTLSFPGTEASHARLGSGLGLGAARILLQSLLLPGAQSCGLGVQQTHDAFMPRSTFSLSPTISCHGNPVERTNETAYQMSIPIAADGVVGLRLIMDQAL